VIVMSIYALWMETPRPEVAAVETALQGNLCRCTGYGPILAAAKAAAELGSPEADVLVRERSTVLAQLAALDDGARVEVSRGADRAILPADADDLAAVLAAEPKATIVAGSTDVGLWITKFMRPISPAVFIGHLADLKRIEVTDDAVTLGAGVTYTECEATIAEVFPHLAEFWGRIGGAQVRNMGTVGGNVANGSPIGDTPPVLIALGAEVTLRKGSERRVVPLEDFFIAYGKQDRAPGDFVESLRIPRPVAGVHHAAYKISKRRDEDISSVCGGFALELADGKVKAARLAFGGMAATPKRAAKAEAALVGRVWDEAAAEGAAAALAEDFTPISDWRASAGYRARVAGNLLRRLLAETTDDDAETRLVGDRSLAHA
jgi:xanthine dehydrogenase small subunit